MDEGRKQINKDKAMYTGTGSDVKLKIYFAGSIRGDGMMPQSMRP